MTRDLTFLMQQGGWRSLAMVGRYTHAASGDLATAAFSRNWEGLGREISKAEIQGEKFPMISTACRRSSVVERILGKVGDTGGEWAANPLNIWAFHVLAERWNVLVLFVRSVNVWLG